MMRSLLLLLARPWRQPLPALALLRHRFRVMPWDCDLNFHLTNGRYRQLPGVEQPETPVAPLEVLAKIELLGAKRLAEEEREAHHAARPQ